MVTKLSKKELCAYLVIVCVTIIAVGKYYFEDATRIADAYDMYKLFENKHAQSKKKIVKENLVLRYDVSRGEWVVYNKNGSESVLFLAKKSTDGFIDIIPTQKLTEDHVVAHVYNVGTYYGNSAYAITTNIPFDVSQSSYDLFAQEDVIPIIGYHFVIPDKQPITYPSLEIHKTDFRRQIQYMTEQVGCQWFTFSEIVDNFINKGRKVPRNACVISFDDGKRNNYTEAFPILEEFGAKATFFVITDRVGSSDAYMTWRQINDLYKHGHEIGSHSVASGSLVKDLTKGGEDLLNHELKDSLLRLQKKGFETKTFAYPHGECNDRIVQGVKEAGYSAARAIRVPQIWRDKRTTTIGYDDTFKWHMHYIKTEEMTLEQIGDAIMYDGWWQCENGYSDNAEKSGKNTLTFNAKTKPTDRSFGVTVLSANEKMHQDFFLEQSGTYTIDISVGISQSVYKKMENINDFINVFVNDNMYTLINDPHDCVDVKNWKFCTYEITADMKHGRQKITMQATSCKILLDRFRAYRTLSQKEEYPLTILYKTDIK
ncbi:MAG: hypothetical protein CR972_02305 [Candidatus Moraniibacteriota bacterium]|nr:MAG: hypothetical protein CR972_02305 [Candidatus Moranbacteria bacterium]